MVSLLTALSDREKHEVTRLLPYWGLSLDQPNETIAEGMKQCTVSVHGLSKASFQALSRLLAHTGVELEENANTADLYCAIEIRKNTPAPLTLRTNDVTFYLKPLRKHTDEVQTWIHKRLWLPVHDETLTLTFHAREEKNLPEWLSYLIIQHFMRDSFQPLSHLTFSGYRRAVTALLKEINSEFASCQLSLEQPVPEEWPELPPERKPTAQPFNPFKNKDVSHHENPINPFRKQEKNQRSTIDPFRKHNR